MTEPDLSSDRRVTAVAGIAGGVLMAVGTLVPLVHGAKTSPNALRFEWGDLVLVLGISIAMLGVAALVATPRSRVWLLLGFMSSVALLLVAYELLKARPAVSALGAGFPTMAMGAAVGVASGVRGILLQGRKRAGSTLRHRPLVSPIPGGPRARPTRAVGLGGSGRVRAVSRARQR
jgi:hypothetical protein